MPLDLTWLMQPQAIANLAQFPAMLWAGYDQDNQARAANKATQELIGRLSGELGGFGQAMGGYIDQNTIAALNNLSRMYGAGGDFMRQVMDATVLGKGAIPTMPSAGQLVAIPELQAALESPTSAAPSTAPGGTKSGVPAGKPQFQFDWLTTEERSQVEDNARHHQPGWRDTPEGQKWLFDKYWDSVPKYAKDWAAATQLAPEDYQKQYAAQQAAGANTFMGGNKSGSSGATAAETFTVVSPITGKTYKGVEDPNEIMKSEFKEMGWDWDDKLGFEDNMKAVADAAGDAGTQQMMDELPERLQGYRGIYDAGMRDLAGIGEVARGDIASSTRKGVSNALSQLGARGLMNTTLGANYEQKGADNEARALQELDENLGMMRAQFGTDLARDFVNNLTGQLLGQGDFSMQGAQNILNTSQQGWQSKVPLATGLFGQYLGLQQGLMPEGPAPVNWGQQMLGALQGLGGYLGAEEERVRQMDQFDREMQARTLEALSPFGGSAMGVAGTLGGSSIIANGMKSMGRSSPVFMPNSSGKF